jgi:gluconokinase
VVGDVSETAADRPHHVVAMGVAGTGKSTVGELVAADLGVDLIEGDAFHPQSNIDKMSSGQPLTDEDRKPWLQRLAEIVAAEHEQGRPSVLACSALRRSYRDILRGELPEGSMFFVHLHADFAVLDARMQTREHFMPPSLLQSQFDTLEPLEDDEDGVLVDVALSVDEVMAEVRRALQAFRTKEDRRSG